MLLLLFLPYSRQCTVPLKWIFWWFMMMMACEQRIYVPCWWLRCNNLFVCAHISAWLRWWIYFLYQRISFRRTNALNKTLKRISNWFDAAIIRLFCARQTNRSIEYDNCLYFYMFDSFYVVMMICILYKLFSLTNFSNIIHM